VMNPDEYRATRRRRLRAYAAFLARQALRVSRWRDRAFHDFHCREIEHLARDAGGDMSTLAILRLCRAALGWRRPAGAEDRPPTRCAVAVTAGTPSI
jgi:hypothetical protein